jgi:hypothetical protein
MSLDAWFDLLLFMLLLAAASLFGLAASGQFPREYRALSLQSPMGAVILFGSLAVVLVALLAGLLFAWQTIPWYAAVIGGGAPVLFAPLLLRPLPDPFVNGRAALLFFSTIAAAIALVMLKLS